MTLGRDQLSTVFWIAISILVCANFWQDVGSFGSPGPGFFPFWSAVALGGLAFINGATRLLKKKEAAAGQRVSIKWGKVIFVVASLLIYSLLLSTFGYLITTFALMLLLFAVTERPRVWSWLGSALLATFLSYVVFYLWLNVQLPAGKFAFG